MTKYAAKTRTEKVQVKKTSQFTEGHVLCGATHVSLQILKRREDVTRGLGERKRAVINQLASSFTS